MDTLKAKHRKGEADSGCARVARPVSVWATGAGVYPGVGVATDTLGQGRAPTEKALKLEPVVVTATVAPTPLSRTTAPVTVIFREQIATQQATSVTELLLQVPGVHIDQARARGGISSVYGRGSDPNFTVVLIDGVKVNDPTNSRGGSFDFSTLSTDNIERIEIVRDPLSAVYGSDALGGVIPHIGVWYTLEATLVTFRMNAGEGFKLPSFFALGHPLVGNPSLLPETSRSVDAGVSQALWNQRYTRAC